MGVVCKLFVFDEMKTRTTIKTSLKLNSKFWGSMNSLKVWDYGVNFKHFDLGILDNIKVELQTKNNIFKHLYNFPTTLFFIINITESFMMDDYHSVWSSSCFGLLPGPHCSIIGK